MLENEMDKATELSGLLCSEKGAGLTTLHFLVTEGVETPIPNGFQLIDGEDGKLDVPSKFIETLKHPDVADENPMFITVEMPSGPSRFLTLNSVLKKKTEIAHRIWPGDVIWSFAEQIRANKLPGYSGHDGIFNMHEVPSDIPFIWVSAAKAVNKENGKPVTLARGYVRKGSPMRQYIHLEMVDSFSVFSLADSEFVDGDEFGFKGQKVVKVTKAALLSFDAVRKGTEGILGTNVVQKESAKEVEIEAVKVVTDLTAEQLKEHNPQLFAKISKSENSADYEELLNKHQKTLREKADLAEKATIADKVSELFDCEVSEVLATVQEMVTTQQAAVKTAIKEELSKYDNRPNTQQRLKKALARNKFNSASEVAEFVAEELGIIKENSRDAAKKNKVGALSNSRSSKSNSFEDDDLFSDEVSNLAGKTVFEFGGTELDDDDEDFEEDED